VGGYLGRESEKIGDTTSYFQRFNGEPQTSPPALFSCAGLEHSRRTRAETASRNLGEKKVTTRSIEDKGFNMEQTWRLFHPSEPVIAVDFKYINTR
jgi:hypothetical protein